MGSPATIDHDQLLAPVSEENAAGEDLRADASPTSAYYRQKDARKASRAKERSAGLDNMDPDARSEIPDTRADWRPVLEQSVALLTERSKDLELVAWLIEALVRLYGFAGLRDGFRFARDFVSTYWDDFYPLPGDDGVEERLASLAGLNGQDAEGTLIVPIRNVPITEDSGVGPLATWHFQQAISVRQIADPEARQRRIVSGATTMDDIDKASIDSDGEFLKRQYDDLQACRSEFEALTAVLDELCGPDAAPPSSNIKNELDACLEAVKYVSKRVLTEAATPPSGEVAGAVGNDSTATIPQVDDATMNREQAFQQLLQLADYFRKTEPHSPLSYSIERLVRWGRMPLPELLGEIITEDEARNNLFWLAGIKKPDAAE